MKIIIVGAGISGLSLAFFLQQKGFDVQVLERDSQFESDRQGFSLTMQSHTRQILREYELLEHVEDLGHRSKRQSFFNAITGELLYDNLTNDENRFNYPLPRQSIRRLFYDRLKPYTVKFGIKVVDVHDNTVYTQGEEEYQFDYLIACDGVNSTIRHLMLPDIILNDLSLCNVYGLTPLSKLSEETRNLFNNTEIQALDGHHRFFSKPFDQEHQMWELTWPSNDLFKSLYARQQKGEDVRCESLVACQGVVDTWKLNSIKEFMTQTTVENIIVHPLFDMDPKSLDFTTVPQNVIFIGDSIHAMSPYIGMGANEAFCDSYNLAQLFEIARYQQFSNWKQDIAVFYQDLVIRTHKTVVRSRENTLFYHSKDAIIKDKLYSFKKW